MIDTTMGIPRLDTRMDTYSGQNRVNVFIFALRNDRETEVGKGLKKPQNPYTHMIILS